MKKGIGIAIALTVVSLATSITVSFLKPKGLTARQIKELKGLNEMTLQGLNDAHLAFYNAYGRNLHSGEELASVQGSLPKEAFSRSERIVSQYDGKGGWLFDGSGVFSVNHPQVFIPEEELAPTPTPGPAPTPLPDVAARLNPSHDGE